ncbi:MAG: rhomboid family intramembrane serine protease [Pseudomonadota bacterium]
MSTYRQNGFFNHISMQAKILAACVTMMWLTECVDFLLGGALNQLGIVPRQLIGLRGMVFAPFLHLDFAHLLANTPPFICLGWFVMLRRTSDFYTVTAMVMLIGGLGTWLIAAPNTVHIGASGVVFGYLGFLISRGYFERSVLSILLSLAIGFVYGGLIWGVLPGQSGISWQGHLCGFIGGVMMARLLGKRTGRGGWIA